MLSHQMHSFIFNIVSNDDSAYHGILEYDMCAMISHVRMIVFVLCYFQKHSTQFLLMVELKLLFIISYSIISIINYSIDVLKCYL